MMYNTGVGYPSCPTTETIMRIEVVRKTLNTVGND